MKRINVFYAGALTAVVLLMASCNKDSTSPVGPVKDNTSQTHQTQWIQTSQPEGFVTSFAVSGSNLIAGTNGKGVFLSTDNGTNWTPVNTSVAGTAVSALTISGPNLFAGTYGR